MIYNGFDFDATIENKNIVKESGCFRIYIAGKFASYNPTLTKSFLLVCKGIMDVCNVEVFHIGKAEEKLQEYPQLYHELGLMSYEDTMHELMKADALLVSNEIKMGLGTKTFDYLYINKPIIYIGVIPSELSEFIQQFENVYICSDQAQMQHAILRLVKEHPAILTNKNIEEYSRNKQNEKYLHLIKNG